MKKNKFIKLPIVPCNGGPGLVIKNCEVGDKGKTAIDPWKSKVNKTNTKTSNEND